MKLPLDNLKMLIGLMIKVDSGTLCDDDYVLIRRAEAIDGTDFCPIINLFYNDEVMRKMFNQDEIPVSIFRSYEELKPYLTEYKVSDAIYELTAELTPYFAKKY